MLTTVDILQIESLKSRLPRLCEKDLQFVMAHLVALQVCGIPGDAENEKQRLENVVIDYGWRVGYCRYVDGKLNARQRPVSFEEWSERQKQQKGKHDGQKNTDS